MWSVLKRIKSPNLQQYAVRALTFAVFSGVGSASLYAQSPSHAYINSMRSAYNTHYFVSIGAGGMSGDFTTKNTLENGTEQQTKSRWQGYGIRNEIGIEFLKFLQFGVAHTSMNLRSKKDSTENMAGSRFEAAGSLNFYAPLGNLQMGGGLLASRVDYRRQDASSDYYGSGYFYNLGYNYFLSEMISFYADGRKSTENMMRNSGDVLPNSVRTNLSEGSLGFKIWL